MIRVFGFVISLSILVSAALWRTPLSQAVDTNMFALLPTSANMPPVVQNAIDHVRTNFERNQVFVVRHPQRDIARKATLALSSILENSGHYTEIKTRIEEQSIEAILSFYKPFQAGLLSDKSRRGLIEKRTDDLVQQVVRDLFNPLSFSRTTDMSTDPFLFFPSFLDQLTMTGSQGVYLDDGLSTFETEDGYHAIIRTVLAESPFIIHFQESVNQALTIAEARLTSDFPGISLSRSGVIEHALKATRTAEYEVQRVGLGSLLCVVVLVLLVFPGVRPLLGLVITLVSGLLAGVAGCILVFGNIHLLTLISGGSLIGVAVDYSFHFLAHFHYGQGQTAGQTLHLIKGALWLALITSLMSFSGLMGSGFPGLQQIAVFSMVGLFVALLSVLVTYPFLFSARPQKPLSLPIRLIGKWTAMWQATNPRTSAIVVTLILGAFAVVTLPHLEFRDDVRLLNFKQAERPSISALEQISGGPVASQFFLVSGPDTDTILGREEQLFPFLLKAKNHGDVTGFTMISRFFPSPSRQKENRQLVQRFLEQESAPLDRLASMIGLPQTAAEQYQLSLQDETTPLSELEHALNSPFSDEIKTLWMAENNGEMASIVILKGVMNPLNLATLAADIEGVTFIDYINVMSDTLGQYRQRALWLVFLAYLAILYLMYHFFGSKGLWGSTVVFLGASILICGTLVLLGDGLNLFHVVGGILVYGIGVDYIIFLLGTGDTKEGPMLAISMSALTTIFAFGLLSFSSLGALHAFGLTVLTGIIAVFLLASIVIPDKR